MVALQGAGIDLTLNLAATAPAAGACCLLCAALPALHFMAYFAAHYAARDRTKRKLCKLALGAFA